MSMGMAVMMVVTAMLVVVMVVVAMAVVMVMTMIVVVRMIVRLARRMRMAVAVIGAAFGIERRLDLDHPRAETFHHFLDDVIAPDAQRFR